MLSYLQEGIDDVGITEYHRNSLFVVKHERGIAQSGSAPALGAGCRGFESLYPEKLNDLAGCVAAFGYEVLRAYFNRV
jgi:hypothetical protein